MGENQAPLREETCAALGFLRVALSPGGGAVDAGDRRLSAADSAVDVLVIRAREDVETVPIN